MLKKFALLLGVLNRLTKERCGRNLAQGAASSQFLNKISRAVLFSPMLRRTSWCGSSLTFLLLFWRPVVCTGTSCGFLQSFSRNPAIILWCVTGILAAASLNSCLKIVACSCTYLLLILICRSKIRCCPLNTILLGNVADFIRAY